MFPVCIAHSAATRQAWGHLAIVRSSCPLKNRKQAKLVADVRLRRHGRPPMSVRLAMSEICPKWHAEVLDRAVAADTLVAGDSEEDDEEEEDEIEQEEEEDTEDDGYSE